MAAGPASTASPSARPTRAGAPAASGGRSRSTSSRRASLVKWVVKTTMVFELRATCLNTFEQRSELRRGFIPAATLVWIGRYEGTRFLSTAVAKGLIYDVAEGERNTRQPGNALTISVGKFVVQILSIRPPDNVAVLRVPMPRRFSGHTVVLWPPSSDPLTWPPASGLNDSELAEFMARFADEVTPSRNLPS